MENKIGTKVGMGARDARGRPITVEKKIIFGRLKKYHAIRTETDFEKELERLRSVVGIPKPCVEQALEIYKQAKLLDIRMSPEAVAAAALYMACRMLKMPRPLDELVRYTKATRKKVARCYRLLLRELNVKVPVSDPMLYISRIAGQLKLGGEVVKTAVEILQKAKRAGITAGKDPVGLAAAAVYIAALMHGYNRTQKEVANMAGIAVPTLREKIGKLIRLVNTSLKGEKVVETNGRRHVVKIIDGSAEVVKSESGKKLLRIKVAAEVDGVRSEYEITFGRYGRDNVAVGHAYARADAPGGREEDAERLVAVVKALTGKEPRASRRGDGRIDIVCGRQHLEGFRRYAELAEAVEEWLGK